MTDRVGDGIEWSPTCPLQISMGLEPTQLPSRSKKSTFFASTFLFCGAHPHQRAPEQGTDSHKCRARQP
jgi:hypothetical protein